MIYEINWRIVLIKTYHLFYLKIIHKIRLHVKKKVFLQKQC